MIFHDEQVSQYARSLIEASLDPLIIISPQGKIKDVNKASVKLTGVSKEQLLGTDLSIYFAEPEKAREGYRKVFDAGFVSNYPLTLRHENGKLAYVLFNASVYKNEKENTLIGIVVMRDVPEQKANELIIANKELAFQNEEKEKRAAELIIANKELVFQNEEKEKRANELIIANKELAFQNEEKEKRAAELIIADLEIIFQNKEREKREIAASELKAFNLSIQRASLYARSLLEAATDPLVTISPEGKITDVNEASVKVTGVSRDKLIGTDFSDYFTEPKKANEGYKQVFEKGVVSDYPLTICHENGTLTDVLYNASVYKDDEGGVLGVFAAARDVTAQKKLERDVADREKELERLVELERFRKLTVGRELKMIELKKENEELRKKLGVNQDQNS
jgi:PAS domain S-box-containing protein